VTGITYPNSSTNSFAYNGFDARISKTDSTGTTAYQRDGTRGTDPVINDGTANYTPGISERRSSATKFLHSDQLGSVALLTDSSEQTTDSRQYDAFGMLVTSSGSTVTPFGFAGTHTYQSDSDSGLMLLGHRYYDPATGRFISRDPIGDGRNWFTYCNSNPTTWVDENGLGQQKLTRKQRAAVERAAFMIELVDPTLANKIRGMNKLGQIKLDMSLDAATRATTRVGHKDIRLSADILAYVENKRLTPGGKWAGDLELARTLAHEWVHTDQGKFTWHKERTAYQAEIDFMTKIKGKITGKARLLQWQSQLDELKHASTQNGGPTFAGYGDDWGNGEGG
jgi:RHS repeat-associated protein